MTCTATETDADNRIRELLAEHGAPLARFVQRLTPINRQAAEDVLQETMVRAWRNLDSLPPQEDGRNRRWLFTVARRLVIDEARRRQVRPVEVTANPDLEYAVLGDETADKAIANDALRQAVGRLSNTHRQALYEVYFRDRSVEAVAADLNIPVGTVRSRIHYALRTIRAAVSEG
ncbi:sigma-70 family RNA polymerase sigma factor [Paractinoplanes hotanensis]|uniref:Sigma-70 family RNA polymerase sigma factor n=1 Tax=Paractinoplanes hotanensis TaxID=2906497 RepID=A0ABT0YCF6_9ACTN|nr:sigma-70 family RNA polymerase sigma factor [Actinoplanes hotanensis]MCM4083435.1 sigma-70 family RNA polymerase sigma factor [Actinoplanes hotanensis]